jgi:hypothetical protein
MLTKPGIRARAIPRSEKHSEVLFKPLNRLEILPVGDIFAESLGDSGRGNYYPNRYEFRFYSRRRRKR